MNLMTFLVRSVELEMASASIYERMAELVPNSSVGRHLKALANDESRNASAIRIRSRFDQEIMDNLIQINLEDGEIKKRIADGATFLNKLQPGFSVSEVLDKMLDFESQVEDIHLAAYYQIRNSSFKQLVMTLIKSNRSHIQTLRKLKEAHLSVLSGGRG